MYGALCVGLMEGGGEGGQRDFENAIARTRPTVNGEDLVRQVKWTEEFGQEG
jgi:SpoVK/Ycf46/Vps4 family AAA+-type ATPase